MNNSNAGFSLVELIITVAVVSILAMLGTPSYHQLMNDSVLTTESDQLVKSLLVARNLALENNQIVIVCPSRLHQSCDKTAQWQHGWMIFIDKNRNRILDDADELFQVFEGSQQIKMESSRYRKKVVYYSSGMALGSNLTIRISDDQGVKRSIIVSNTGRVRVEAS